MFCARKKHFFNVTNSIIFVKTVKDMFQTPVSMYISTKYYEDKSLQITYQCIFKDSVYICNNIKYTFKEFISNEQNISKIIISTNES